MKNLTLIFFLLMCGTVFAGQGGIYSGNPEGGVVVYDHEVDAGNVNFSWSLDGDRIYVKVRAATKGWVAVGFNPEDKMKGANIIMGYVKNGSAVVSDQYGSKKRNHREDVKSGGGSHVADVYGHEKAGVTEICFSVPLNSGDDYDKPINRSGMNLVMLAHGSGRDSFKGGHVFRTLYRIDLESGEFEKIK